MKQELVNNVTKYVEDNIGNFHTNRINKLNSLQLGTVLKRKNPYLFRAKYLLTAAEIVEELMDAFLSSAEETIFGDWLEGLAIYVCQEVYGGRKSGIEGMDLEFDKDGVHYIVTIKSGPNWGNSSQLSKMEKDFDKAKRIFRTTSGSQMHIQAVNGCCYGKDSNPEKSGDYVKYCGQRFWHFLSGEATLYIDIIEPLSAKSKEWNDTFRQLRAKRINLFTQEFMKDFCCPDGSIDWQKLVIFNSGNDALK
jgi:hypothetical protein